MRGSASLRTIACCAFSLLIPIKVAVGLSSLHEDMPDSAFSTLMRNLIPGDAASLSLYRRHTQVEAKLHQMPPCHLGKL